jgi:hypothetical protein
MLSLPSDQEGCIRPHDKVLGFEELDRREDIMRAWVFGILGVAAIAAPADAQMLNNEPPLVGPPAEYVVPLTIPAGGCVWDNAVFSNGAIFERFIGRPFYFRCMNGQWQSFYSFYEARIGRDDPPSPARGPDRRPTPLR